MKIAITGKGGVGKTTITSLLAIILKQASKKVILIDADPDMNLAALLGIPENIKIKPISELKLYLSYKHLIRNPLFQFRI